MGLDSLAPAAILSAVKQEASMSPDTTKPHVFDATTATFEAEVLQASMDTPILVDFWAEWCGPCKALGPILEKIAADFHGSFLLAKVDTEAEPQIAGAFQIRSIPTVFLVRGGQIVDGFQGALPEGQVREFLKHHGIEPGQPQDADPDPADSAPLDPAAEVARLRTLAADEPDKAEHQLDLALALLRTGEAAEASTLLDGLPANLSTDDRAVNARARLGFAAALEGAPSAATLRATLESNPDDHVARHLLGTHLLLGGESEAGLDAFLDILRRDREFGDALGKRALIDAFRILDDAELVGRYRRKMSSLLF